MKELLFYPGPSRIIICEGIDGNYVRELINILPNSCINLDENGCYEKNTIYFADNKETFLTSIKEINEYYCIIYAYLDIDGESLSELKELSNYKKIIICNMRDEDFESKFYEAYSLMNIMNSLECNDITLIQNYEIGAVLSLCSYCANQMSGFYDNAYNSIKLALIKIGMLNNDLYLNIDFDEYDYLCDDLFVCYINSYFSANNYVLNKNDYLIHFLKSFRKSRFSRSECTLYMYYQMIKSGVAIAKKDLIKIVKKYGDYCFLYFSDIPLDEIAVMFNYSKQYYKKISSEIDVGIQSLACFLLISFKKRGNYNNHIKDTVDSALKLLEDNKPAHFYLINEYFKEFSC